MEEVNEIITKMLIGCQQSIPNEEWDTFTLKIYSLNKMIELNAFYEINNEIISFNPEKSEVDVTMESKSLREKMYELSSEQGAWFSVCFKVNNEGEFSSDFEYVKKPNFSYEPSKEKYIEDLKTFPRQEGSIPVWLKEKLES